MAARKILQKEESWRCGIVWEKSGSQGNAVMWRGKLQEVAVKTNRSAGASVKRAGGAA